MPYPKEIIDALDQKYHFTSVEKKFLNYCDISEDAVGPLNHHRTMLQKALTVNGMEEIIRNDALNPEDLLIVEELNGFKHVSVLSESSVQLIVEAYNAIKNTAAFSDGRITLYDMLIISEKHGHKYVSILSASHAQQAANKPERLNEIRESVNRFYINMFSTGKDKKSAQDPSSANCEPSSPRL